MIPLFEWLIYEAFVLGDDELILLQNELVQIWSDPESMQYWSPQLCRSVLLALLGYETTAEWADAEIRNLLEDDPVGTDIYGQIREAFERARVWSLLDETEHSVNWVEKAVQASLGVGYRKDYQLDSWIQWLGRWNKLEPGDEVRRMEVYAHRVAVLDQTTEGRAANFAALKLLEVTREWSPSQAIDLFWWLFNHKCLWYFDAVRQWIAWYVHQAEKKSNLELAPAIAMLNALCLPWWDVKDNDFFVRLLHLIAKRGKKCLEFESDRMKQIISSESLAQVREGLLKELAQVRRQFGVDELSIDESTFTDEKTKGTSPSDGAQSRSEESILVLSDGTRLTLTEVIEKIANDRHKLRDLIDAEYVEEGPSARFQWEKVILALTKKLQTAEEITEVVDHTRSLGEHKPVLLLAERSADIGHVELARELAISVLSASTSMGWARSWDGGLRQRPYSILVQIDAAKYRPEAFDAFARDMERDESVPIHWLVQDLDHMVSIFGTSDVELEVCKLVEEHVIELFKGTPASNEQLDFPHRSSGNADGPVESTIHLLTSHLTFPVPELRIRVLRALTEMCLEHPRLAIPFIREELIRDEIMQEHLLALCEAVAQKDSKIIKPVVDTVRPLVYSDHFGIAETASRVLFLCGVSVPSLEPLIAKPASSLLSNAILVPDEFDDLPGHSLIPSDQERISPFGPQARALARASGLKERTIFHLCAQLLNKWGATPAALKRQEEILQSRRFYLRLAYIRPKAALSRRAIHHLATQLRQQGLLTDEDALKSLCANEDETTPLGSLGYNTKQRSVRKCLKMKKTERTQQIPKWPPRQCGGSLAMQKSYGFWKKPTPAPSQAR